MSHPFITHLKKDHEKQHRLGEQLTKATDPQRRKTLLKELYEETRRVAKRPRSTLWKPCRSITSTSCCSGSCWP